MLVAGGDTAGWLTPCGCASNQSGGLSRRAAYIEQLRTSCDVLLLDVGGAAGGTTDYQRMKFEAILEGEAAMGLDVHNLGASEIALGAAYLRDVSSRLGIRFVSANVADGGGVQWVESVRMVERGGKRIAVTGVVSRKYSSVGVKIADPIEAAVAAVRTLKNRPDVVVVLAYLPEEELTHFADSIPEADVVIGGPTGQSMAPSRRGATMLASATNKGKFMVEMALPPGKGQSRVVEINDRFPESAVQNDVVHNYLERLGAQDFTADSTGLVSQVAARSESAFQFAGSNSCRECHGRDCNALQDSGHTKAWKTLEAKRFHVDPYCQQCHTTGYGMAQGFVSARRSQDRVNVGCESCHGPSSLHVKDQAERTPWKAGDQCVRCHDAENSPSFDYAVYWAKVRHGAPADPARSTDAVDSPRKERP